VVSQATAYEQAAPQAVNCQILPTPFQIADVTLSSSWVRRMTNNRWASTFVKSAPRAQASRKGEQRMETVTQRIATFDGPLGFWDVFRWQGRPGAPVELAEPGRPLGFEAPGVGIKPYPCGSPLFSVAEGMLAWKRELRFAAEEVEAVRAEIHPSA
jgi:hypothetical protein